MTKGSQSGRVQAPRRGAHEWIHQLGSPGRLNINFSKPCLTDDMDVINAWSKAPVLYNREEKYNRPKTKRNRLEARGRDTSSANSSSQVSGVKKVSWQTYPTSNNSLSESVKVSISTLNPSPCITTPPDIFSAHNSSNGIRQDRLGILLASSTSIAGARTSSSTTKGNSTLSKGSLSKSPGNSSQSGPTPDPDQKAGIESDGKISATSPWSSPPSDR